MINILNAHSSLPTNYGQAMNGAIDDLKRVKKKLTNAAFLGLELSWLEGVKVYICTQMEMEEFLPHPDGWGFILKIQEDDISFLLTNACSQEQSGHVISFKYTTSV